MSLGGVAISKDSIVFQQGRGGHLLEAYELARVNAQFASGAITNTRPYNLGTAVTTAVAPFVVPRDFFVSEIRGFVQNQTADITTFDVHYSEPASGQYTIFALAERPSTVTGAISIASGAPAVSTVIQRQEWLAGTPVWVYADAQGANASGAVVYAIGRTVRD